MKRLKNNIAFPLVGIVAVIAIVGGSAWWYFSNEENINPSILVPASLGKMAATLAYQQGDVQVSLKGAEWSRVFTDTILHTGDSIKTGTDSKAIIELEDGDVIRLGYNTEITLSSLLNHKVEIIQAKGASYHRVAKGNSREYLVFSEGLTVKSLGTAFDVVDGGSSVDVSCLESKLKIFTGDESKNIEQGKSVKFDKNGSKLEVGDIDKSKLVNDWYTWNREEDSKKTDKLGILSDFAGPKITISSPEPGSTRSADLKVSGQVDKTAVKLMVNGNQVDINGGLFSTKVSLDPGNNLITVVAENSNGYRTIKEIRIIRQVAEGATPLILEAATENDGVHLKWNTSAATNFQYYKVVRSEGNADLKYPDDGYIAKRNLGFESYIDTSTESEKSYYYRVCEVLSGNKVFCSNVVYMKGKRGSFQDQSSKADESKDTEKEIADNDGQNEKKTGIFLSAEAGDKGIKLDWEVKNISIGHGFKVVRSLNANPEYPTRSGDDYKYLSNSQQRSYEWPVTDGKTYHFRICQYNGGGACLVYSNDVAVAAPTVKTEDIGLNMSVKAESDGVGIWWTDVSGKVSGFKYYKVVRSEDNDDLRYPDDGYIAVKGSDVLSYRDYSAKKGTGYYYRICAVGDSVYCSNVVKVTAVNKNPAPEAVSLSAVFGDSNLTLNWTKSDEKDFQYYKVVWSQTNSSPAYPADGYLKAISNASAVTYVDDGLAAGSRKSAVDLSTGTNYYSICVVDSAGQVACSNVIKLTDGKIQ